MVSKLKILILALLCVSFSMFICGEASADIFDTLSLKTTDFAKGLRNIAYVISGFGIVMFTFLAISGKINFKHLGYISISLFILAAMGAFIDYTTQGSEAPTALSAKFGDTYQNAGVGELCQSSLCGGGSPSSGSNL